MTAVLLGAARVIAAPVPQGVAVVVLAHEVAAGTTLDAADLRVVTLPFAPDGSAGDPSTLVGRSALVGLPGGLPVVPALLTGARFAVEAPSGTVVLPVEVDAAALLRAGDRVDLLAPGCTDGVLAGAALVVEQPGDRSVLVATSPAEASAVIMARELCPLAAVVVE